MALTALDTCKVMTWLDSVEPGATISSLKKQIEKHFGEIEWHSATGWGEGAIWAKIGELEGCSSGDCTSEEALINLAIKLLDREEKHKTNENNCDWL